MHRQQLLQLLTDYKTPFMEEAAMVARSRRFVAQHQNCFDRSLSAGHVTGSAWVVNPSRTHALMLHHRKLDRWFQPGGHADGDHDIIRVALKETSEESGVDMENIRLVSDDIFDVDVHTIHPNAHDERHQHFDIRFLLEIDDSIPIPGNDESHQIGWIPLDRVSHFNHARSLHRMVQKIRRMQA
ncbi:MAG: NUDIX hydrolase [Gammaproteobacteria bacterium]|nr:NUDIX hydrolase [Gammaproteobacteria bacterium]MCF6230439.1 NUDIX hydrolase [Gammaproteobacteria bacterium]